MLCCITNIFSWEQNNPLFVIHWPSYNQSLVRRDEIFFSYNFLDIWDDLARMNEKIRMAKDTNFLIPSFLSLVISGYAFTFPIDKQKGSSKQLQERVYPKINDHQVIHRPVEEQTNWTSISIAVQMMKTSLSQQLTVQESRIQTEDISGCKISGM